MAKSKTFDAGELVKAFCSESLSIRKTPRTFKNPFNGETESTLGFEFCLNVENMTKKQRKAIVGFLEESSECRQAEWRKWHEKRDRDKQARLQEKLVEAAPQLTRKEDEK